MSEPILRVWENGSDWVVAVSKADAWAVLREETGLTPADFGLTEEDKDGDFWVAVTQPVPMPEYEDQVGSDVPCRKPQEIVDAVGRGYLGSSDA